MPRKAPGRPRCVRRSHTRTPAFQAAYQRLLHDADAGNVAVMCGEPTWWRCHRLMIADLAPRDGHRVQHIMPNGSLAPHHPSDCLTRDLDQAADK
ncbi:DUF488 family protein [Mycobacterium sp.]|uniref:DUF488 family protein n=1 Tax=Mycobacterium sp. TaxID=1785 RepID=UPI002615DE68|nr:DUF488 family protein [Mycobacterium sp.]